MLIFFLVTKDKERKTGVRGNIIYPFLQFFRMWRHQYIARHMMAISTSKTLFTWSGGPRSSGVSFFCFVSPQSVKTKETNPTRPKSTNPCKQAQKQGQLGRKILFMHHATLQDNLTICGLP